MRYRVVIASASACLLLSACGGGREGHTVAGRDAPDWVNRGGGWVTKAAGKHMFAGVGLVSGIPDRSMAIEAADNRAKAEIVKILSTFLTTVFSDYQSSQGPAQLKRAISAASEGSLFGVLIEDRWIDPKTQTYYSLAKLDFNWVAENLAGNPMDEGMKDFVRGNAREKLETWQP